MCSSKKEKTNVIKTMIATVNKTVQKKRSLLRKKGIVTFLLNRERRTIPIRRTIDNEKDK